MRSIKRWWLMRRLARIERAIELTAEQLRKLNAQIRQQNHEHIETSLQLQRMDVVVPPLSSLVRSA